MDSSSASFWTLPVELRAEILSYMTPMELVEIRMLNKDLLSFLDDSANRLIWKNARRRFEPPVPPPPVIDGNKGCWSEAAYAQMIFGGAKCSRKNCKYFIEQPPISFTLKLRFCNEVCIKSAISQGILTKVQDSTRSRTSIGKRVANSIFNFLPNREQLEITELEKLPGPAQIMELRSRFLHETVLMDHFRKAKHEYLKARHVTVHELGLGAQSLSDLYKLWAKRAKYKPLLMKNGRKLCIWRGLYKFQRRKVDESNIKFIKAKMKTKINGVSSQDFMRSSSVQFLLRMHRRDNVYITEYEWTHTFLPLFDRVARQLKVSRNHPRISRTRCALCPRTFKGAPDLLRHMLARHPDVVPPDILWYSKEGKRRCTFCPRREKYYSEDSMKNHCKKWHEGHSAPCWSAREVQKEAMAIPKKQKTLLGYPWPVFPSSKSIRRPM